MVWRKIILFTVFALALLLAMPISASAYSVYTDGNISTTYITIFEDIANSISPFDDYVFFRSGQYDYTMVVGDLVESYGNISSSESVDVYIISTSSGTGYNNVYQYSVTTDSSFSLSVGDALVYSNVGKYPNFLNRGDLFAFSSLLLLLVIVCMYLLRSVFGFCLRSRR